MKDPNVFVIALQNCFWADGRINKTRTVREIKFLARFVPSVFLILVLFSGICATPIVLVHSYVVPVPIIVKLFSAFNVYEEAWEENIFTGQAGDVEEEYEDWRADQRINQQTSLLWQKFLWHSWYILAVFSLYCIFSFYLLVVKLSLALFARYKKQVFWRETVYYSRNREYEQQETSEQMTVS